MNVKYDPNNKMTAIILTIEDCLTDRQLEMVTERYRKQDYIHVWAYPNGYWSGQFVAICGGYFCSDNITTDSFTETLCQTTTAYFHHQMTLINGASFDITTTGTIGKLRI